MDDPAIIIGEREGWNDARPFGISAEDERQHIYIIGKTGSGKTTLLRNLIIQHIAQGHGVGVIDPHGDLAEELLHHVPPIANLSKGSLGHEKANLLGSLLTTQFQLAAMARSNRPEHERRDFYLFIDEFQNFSTDVFASILAEARKYRSCLILSHQYIDQLALPIRQAVFGNVGTLISFRVGYADAEVLEKEFGHTFPASAIADLNRYEVIVKLLEDGANREPFRARMLPPIENRVGRKDKLIARSRERFAVRRRVIEDKLNRWMDSGQ